MPRPKKEIRYRLIHTIPEAMILLHVSKRNEFFEKYIYSGLIGLYDGNKIPRADIERVIQGNTVYYMPADKKG